MQGNFRRMSGVCEFVWNNAVLLLTRSPSVCEQARRQLPPGESSIQ